MTLNEAIETLRQEYRRRTDITEEKWEEAKHLGSEALKRENANRDNPDFVIVGKLPGETTEQKGGTMITLKKAIEILDLNVREAHKNIPLDVLDALKLMIEAGKSIQRIRRAFPYDSIGLLPGETEE